LSAAVEVMPVWLSSASSQVATGLMCRGTGLLNSSCSEIH